MRWARIGAGATVGAAAVLLALALLYLVRAVLVILLISIIFAQAITPLVLRLRRFGARRAPAVLAIYLLIALALAGLFLLLGQAVSGEAGKLTTALPQLQSKLQAALAGIPDAGLRGMLSSAIGSNGNLPSSPGPAPGQLLQTAMGLAEFLFSAFSVFVITFYWISERLVIRRAVVRLLPAEHRQQGLLVWEHVEEKLGAWVRGQLLLMLFIGVTFSIGLTAMGVQYSLLLGVFAGIAEIVPLVGPYIGGAPAVLIALTQGPGLALGVAAFVIVVQLIEGNVLVPRIMGHSTGVSPLTVILGILVGSKLTGIVGALLAVPVAAAAQVLLADLGVFGEGQKPDFEDPSRSSATSSTILPPASPQAPPVDAPGLPQGRGS